MASILRTSVETGHSVNRRISSPSGRWRSRTRNLSMEPLERRYLLAGDLPPGGSIDASGEADELVGTIQGIKWQDLNGDGLRNADEPGLAGVRIYLDANLNNQFDEDEPHTVTQRDNPVTDFDEAGLYGFPEVRPGFYIVREIEPAGYQQTFPEEFLCDAIFCVGRGHMVYVEPGQSYDDLNFGNRPATETATVEGVKWIDLNGNGQRERNEPPMAGVVIYADLNDNRQRDDNEPFTRSLADDPATPMNEAGLYRLEGVPAKEVVIREVVPEEYHQTYPTEVTEILDSVSVDVPGGRAYDLQWLTARSEVGPEGRIDLGLTFEVTWRDGCGTLLPDQAKVDREGDRIHVQLFGTHIGRACTLALKPESQTVRLSDVPAGRYAVRTVLMESPRPGEEFEPSFVLEGRLSVGGPGGHAVVLQPGEVRQGLHFGNQPLGEPNLWLGRADFDYDGYLTAQDIDLLAAAIRDPESPIGRYDLSDDGLLSLDDLRVMVRRALGTHFGDSNLDGRFDTADFVKVLRAGKYELGPDHPAGWEEGDWNGDGFFDVADLVFVLQEGGYESGPSPAATPLAASAIDQLLSLAAADDRLKSRP